MDVDIKLGQRRVAVELLVEGVEKEMGNIAKVLSSDLYDALVLVAADEDSLSKLRDLAREATEDVAVGKTAISFRLLGEFLPEKLS